MSASSLGTLSRHTLHCLRCPWPPLPSPPAPQPTAVVLPVLLLLHASLGWVASIGLPQPGMLELSAAAEARELSLQDLPALPELTVSREQGLDSGNSSWPSRAPAWLLDWTPAPGLQPAAPGQAADRAEAAWANPDTALNAGPMPTTGGGAKRKSAKERADSHAIRPGSPSRASVATDQLIRWLGGGTRAIGAPRHDRPPGVPLTSCRPG